MQNIVSTARDMLIRLGFLFPEADREEAFLQAYVYRHRSLVQLFVVFGAVLTYTFFLWDQVIDPVNYKTTHFIRGVIATPVLCLLLVLLQVRRFHKHQELISVIGLSFVGDCLSIIYLILNKGFDYGIIGLLLDIFFGAMLLPMRITYFSLFVLPTLVIFEVLAFFAPTTNSNMFLINMLSGCAAAAIGSFGAWWRETAARQAFVAAEELEKSRYNVSRLERSNLKLRSENAQLLGSKRESIFISYRRADSEAIAGRIRDRLAGRFGESAIFMDIDNLAFGDDFRQRMIAAARKTYVLIAIIGPHWAGSIRGGRSRILMPDDPIRVEIETALESNVPIIPVLISGAKMPSNDDLPESIRDLSFRNALSLDSGQDFHHHVDRLIRSIETNFKMASE